MSGDIAQAVLPGSDAPWINPDRRDGHPCGICGNPIPPKRHQGGEARKHCSDACRRTAWERAHPGRRGWQAALPGESRVERAFAEWIASAPGRYVEREVVRLAREDRAAGDQRGEINLLLALVRRTSRGLAKDPAGYRCNNSHRSLLARRVMAEYPDLAGFFEVRDLRGRR